MLEETFIGLTDRVDESIFVWVDGTPLDYSNWAPEDPNDYRYSEDVAIITGPHGLYPGLWLDTSDTERHSFICERPSRQIPGRVRLSFCH